MPAQLVALCDGPSIWLDKPVLLVGRHPECDVQIDSRKISRRHCCIAQVGDTLLIRDLGSTNGVRINGTRVAEGRLAPGDELTIGSHRYRVRWDSAVKAAAARPVKETARAAGDLEDLELDSSDEPVPLPERRGSARPTETPRPAGALPARRDEEPAILPDKIELASPSDVYPLPPRQPPD